MAYKIGTVTLTLSAVISGSLSSDTPQPFADVGTGGSFTLQADLGPITAAANGTLSANLVDESPTYGYFDRYCSASGGAPDEEHTTGALSADLTGSISLSVPCDICWEYVGQSPNPFAAGGVVDSPPYRLKRFFLVGNGDASASASVAGVSSSGTVNVRGVEITPQASAFVSVTGVGAHELFFPDGTIASGRYFFVNGSGSCSLAITCNLPSGTTTASSASYSGSGGGGTGPGGYPLDPFGFSAAGSGSVGGVSATATNADTARGQMGYTAARSWSLSGVLRAMQGAYPDALTLSCARYAGDPSPTFSATGSFSRSYTQTNYSTGALAGVGATVNTDSHSLNDFADIAVGIVGSSLSAVGDEPLATRVLMRGKATQGMDLTQAGTTTVDDFAGGTAAATGGATVGVSGGVLSIATAGTPGGATRAYSPDKRLTGYSYLRVRLRSVGSANVPAVFGAGGQTWNLTTGADGMFVDRDLDLCAPDGAALSSFNDAWDTRWPEPTAPSVTSGPFNVSSVSFTGIPASRTVEIDSLTLVRVNAPTVDLMPTLYPSVYSPTAPSVSPEWPLEMGPERTVSGAGTTSQDYVRRLLLVNTDGRQGPEEADLFYTRTTGGATGVTSYTFNHRSIASLAAEVNAVDSGVTRWPGWTATPAVPAPSAFSPAYSGQPAPIDPYYNNAAQLLGGEMYGGGAYYAGGSWSFGWDRPAGAIPAQPLYDAVRPCGMEGDAEGHGGGGGPYVLVLKAAAILRAGAHGLVFDGNRDRKSGQAIDLVQSTVVVAGGTSRSPDGWYRADNAPAGKPPGASGVVQKAGSTSPSVSLGILYTRHRHRGSLLIVETPAAGWISVDISQGQRAARATTQSGVIYLGGASDYGAATWSDASTGVTGDRPCVRFDRASRESRLYFTYESGGVILRRHTDNEGGAVSVSTTIFSAGTLPTFCVAPNGAQYHFARTGSGAISCRHFDAQGTQIYPSGGGSVTAVASGVADAASGGALCAWVNQATGRIFLEYVDTGGAVQTVKSDDGGKTFS